MGLVRIKLLHTAAWVFFVGCIVSMPLAALRDHFGWAVILGCVVLAEGVVIVANGGRCPLTAIAARYTDDRSDNFDIYLPVWLARHNKTIFTTIYALGVAIVIWRW